MNVKPFWEIKDYHKKQHFSLNILIKKLEPHKNDIWKLNNNFGEPQLNLRVNDIYPTKLPSILLSTQTSYEHIIIDIMGNCNLGYPRNKEFANYFHNREKIETKIKEILCSGK